MKSKEKVSWCAFTLVILTLAFSSSVASAAITVRDVQTSNETSSATITVNRPVGTISNDILIAQINIRSSGTTPAITPPTGWVLINIRSEPEGSSGYLTQALYYKAITNIAAEPLTYQWIQSGSKNISAGITAIAGVNIADPIIGVSDNSNQTRSLVDMIGFSVNAEAGSMLLSYFGTRNVNAELVTPPDGMTELYVLDKNDSVHPGIYAFYQSNPDNPTLDRITQVKDGEDAKNVRWIAQMVTLRERPPAVSVPTLSEWGMIFTAILLLIVGIVYRPGLLARRV